MKNRLFHGGKLLNCGPEPNCERELNCGTEPDVGKMPAGGKFRRCRRALSAALTVMLAVVSALAVSGCGGEEGPYAGQTLRVYNAGAYTGDNLLGDFEYMTGARVVMDEFESNEQMYIKIANGDSYDVIIPSDYMIERLLQENLLQPLDKSKITCLDMLADGLKGLPYDPDNSYSVPYFWGTVGIIYDKTKVDIADLEREGFGIFLDTKYKGDLYVYDSERDSFMMALKYLGYSMNTDNEQELNEAYDFLVQCVTTMEPEIVTDEIIDNMAQGRKAFGLVYSGDANYIMTENENMGFYEPETGTNVWSDCMVIPKNAENVPLAHEFINFVMDYDAAYDNSSCVGYASPNADVLADMTGPGGEFSGISSYIPRSDNPNDEVFSYNEKTRKIMAELWSKVKIAASNAE